MTNLSKYGRTALAVVITAALTGIAGFGTLAEPAAAAGDPGAFFDGQIRYSSIINCFSIIQGAPYAEYGAGAYVGVYTDADETTPIPAVNQTVYMHIVVYGLGNSCSGQRFVPALSLPSGMSFDTSASILCFTQSGQASSLSDCPQWGNVQSAAFAGGAPAYYSTDSPNANTWPLPQGAFWEFRFPVKSSTLQSGATMNGFVKMFDGNDSPVLHPTSLVYVFGPGAGASILYDAPSTYATPTSPLAAATPYGIISEARVVTNSVAGNILIRRTNAGGSYDPDTIAVPVNTTYSSWRIWTDWDEPLLDALVPNTVYRWAVGFDPGALGSSGGSPTWGGEQTFRSLSASTCLGQPVTVGLQLGQLPTSGNDVIMGTSGVDNIDASAGNDTVCAMGGNDTVIGGSGNDRIDGGAGNDTASYADSASGVRVSLATSAAQGTIGAGTDTITNTENLNGGSGSDTLTGSVDGNVLSGGPGNDVINGGSGDDVLNGGPGNDTLKGASGSDTVSYAGSSAAVTVSLATTAAQSTVGAGSDTITGIENLAGGNGSDRLTGAGGANSLSGGSGADLLLGGAGNDTIAGGPGTDTVTYAGNLVAVAVSLAITSAQSTGGAGSDTITGAENLTGGIGNDNLTGNSGNNTLNGGPGTDRCTGGAGTDIGTSCEIKAGIP